MKATRLPRLLPAALGLLLAAAALPGRASARFLFTIAQSGANVLVTGSGTLNTTALTLGNTATLNPQVFTGFSEVYSGPLGSTVQSYTGITAPNLGTSSTSTNAASGTGNFVGAIGFIQPGLYVPTGYVSGTTLADTSTYANTTVAALGLTPGTYTYTWGAGTTADSLVVTVAPEPATWTLLGVGAAGLGALALRRRARRA